MESYLAYRVHEVGGKPFNEREALKFYDVYELTTEKMKEIEKTLKKEGYITRSNAGSSLELICGGPPCQGYSGIGHRRSYAVDKADIPSNQLYQKMAEIVEFFRPKMFLFENVKGLMSSKWRSDGKNGEIWEAVRKEFREKTGVIYEVRWSLVHAKDYGVPTTNPPDPGSRAAQSQRSCRRPQR